MNKRIQIAPEKTAKEIGVAGLSLMKEIERSKAKTLTTIRTLDGCIIMTNRADYLRAQIKDII